jgi:hypothetical protein
MPKDIHVPARIVGRKIPVKASLGQTVIVTEGPEEYTGPVTVTPTDEPQTLQTADKLVKSDISVNPIPSEYIIPNGTEVISVTENGTVTVDVTNKASVTVNTNVPIPPGYIIPTGNLGITENGQYDISEKASVTVDVPAPVPTGTKEISISENGEQTVDVSGFALAHILTSVPVPQGGLEYEAGTYVPETNGVPTINFANPHAKAPSIIIFQDVSQAAASQSVIESFVYINSVELFGAPLIVKKNVYYNEYVAHLRKAANGSIGSAINEYAIGEVTATSFKPFAANNFGYSVGQTYKWIAIWT